MLLRFARRAVALVTLVVMSCGGKTSGVSDGDYRLKVNPDGSPTGNGSTCSYSGQTSSIGETFKSPDGCNDCKCTAQGVACTERDCSSGGGTGCTYEGKHFQSGESWTIPNPECPAASARCSCGPDGKAVCRAPAIACAKPPDDCAPGACGPALGMPNYQCEDGTVGGPGPCERQSTGTCGWTIRTCTCKDDQGKAHAPGDTWESACNSCTCSSNGAASCTKVGCKCPPNGTIDCMPAVPPERKDLCDGPYHDWITSNCPGVSFTY